MKLNSVETPVQNHKSPVNRGFYDFVQSADQISNSLFRDIDILVSLNKYLKSGE